MNNAVLEPMLIPYALIPCALQKLLKATNYKVAVQAESTQESNFKLSSDPIKQKIFTDRIKIYPKISAAIPWVYPDNALYALKEIL